MSAKRAPPLAGIALAAVTCLGMIFAGSGLWLALGVAVIWAGSLWLTLPEPEAEAPRINAEQASRDATRGIIESLGSPLLVLEGTRITQANAAAREALGGHIVDQDARIALRHPDAMRLLEMGPDEGWGESVIISGFTGGRSLWQLTRRRIDKKRWLIELTDRTSESDISRAHTDFVANASHELRTPLAAIIGYVETLTEGGPAVDEAARTRFYEVVLREARRMQSLVEDLMSLSHVEAEKNDRPSEPIDLTKLTARVVGEIGSIQGRNRLVTDFHKGQSTVLGNAAQLEQLLRNLIDNALKYGDPDEPVSVRIARAANGGLCLAITDRGPGIAPEHLPHLTRRFYRTDPSRSRAAGGTGLGLAIVKHIVERHRAQLDIVSELGKGTTFTVSFPAPPQGAATGMS
jgi:two-component system, OmpR family, phosphate regulon sensor histidine kinase PhoR